jgi:hypothetical protein
MVDRLACLLALPGVLLVLAGAAAEVPSPALEGPITGGAGVPFVAATAFDLAQVGYTEAEYFITGTATAYTAATPLAADGRWTVAPSAVTAPYRTRILVYRPMSPKRFDGTVMVEWLNVSGGLDAAPDWITAHTEMVRRGMAWVGVSAQRIGVEGGASIVGLPPMSLKTTDAVRYGTLSHPGDSFSYDIFSQAGQAVRRPAGANPLGPLRPKRLIAAGESQSAFRMVTYIDGVHPLAGVYDGFLVHSRGIGGAPLSEPPQPLIGAPRALIRDDVDVPVLVVQMETDLTLLRSLGDRQPDGDRFRLWEVAGTAHADTYTLTVGRTDLGDSPDAAALVVTTTPIPGLISCPVPINSGPQHFVVNAAVAALERWVRRGKPAPRAPRIELIAAPPGTIARDAHGNALGGIRTPQLDAPIATLRGDGQTGTILCLLFGTTVPFDDARLASLYRDHGAYVAAVRKTTRRAVRAGFVRRSDAKLILREAAGSDIGR